MFLVKRFYKSIDNIKNICYYIVTVKHKETTLTKTKTLFKKNLLMSGDKDFKTQNGENYGKSIKRKHTT